MLTILTSGDKDGDSEVLELTHLPTSLEVTRRVQIVRQYLKTIPRRRLADGAHGKTIIPANTVLQQISDILSTPTILAGATISPTIPKMVGPQVTEEEEKCNAGDPAEEGDDANPELISQILTQMAEFTVSMQKIQATSDATTARMQKIQATIAATTASTQALRAQIDNDNDGPGINRPARTCPPHRRLSTYERNSEAKRVAAEIKAEESERARLEALATRNLVLSNANQYSRAKLPPLVGIPGQATTSLQRFISIQRSGHYTAEQCVQAILKQDKSNNAERKPAAKLMLRRQKRLDRMVSEGNVKLELGSSEYYLYLFSEYCRAWPREFGMDADSAQRVSDIRRISHLLRRARCYWGLAPIEYWDKLQEWVAALDALHHPFPLSEMNTIYMGRHLLPTTPALTGRCNENEVRGGYTLRARYPHLPVRCWQNHSRRKPQGGAELCPPQRHVRHEQ